MVWTRVTADVPCPICFKPDWCRLNYEKDLVICNRKESYTPCTDNGGGWFHSTQGIYVPPTKAQDTSLPEYVSKRKLHKAYSNLLDEADYLSPECLKYLEARAIKKRSLFAWSESVGDLGHDPEEVRGVPGFYRNPEESFSRINLPRNCLLIPFLSIEGCIYGLQARHVETKQYLWVSSRNYPNGTPATVRLHWAFPASVKNYSEIWITEGAIKAESITQNLGHICVGLPGIGAVGSAIKDLRQELPHHPHKMVVALDQDGNPNTDRAREVLFARKAVPGPTFTAEWPKEFKGVDDAIAGGAEIKTIQVVNEKWN